ncbi:MAG: hypothetical protein HRT55_16790 [Colwellia sp.]|uniref:hypothetical protein n=1 Tax=Alteromonadales TaxID=135622 RepID=UPI001DB26220|nr:MULTISPECIES: hypothetical protein [Alteromonadales]NQZ27965.1 hypothetical protein [Colwellia sp.]NRA81914.1 hypothetical protein [Pseudoalteromonas sp.]
MANKKIRAYAKSDSDNFIKDERGRTKFFYIWQVLKLKENDIFEFNKLTFFSTQIDESKRARMTPVIKGFFRYIENSNGGVVSGDGESLSHSIAILVLSELDSINFVFGKVESTFHFSEIKTEDLKIRFENGRFYFPDLVGFFSNNSEYSEKWGGKVAIEVKVTHGCEPEKTQDFLNHNIPIIEIYITEKLRFQKELSKQPFDENDLERYYNFLTGIFSKKVYGKVLVDPSSESYNKKLISYEQQKNIKTKKLLASEAEKSDLLNQKLIISNDGIRKYKDTLDAKNIKLKEYEVTLKNLDNRTLLQKFFDVFK